MVNWHDPSVLKDYSTSRALHVTHLDIAIDNYLVALIKLYHTIGGIYMCVRLHKLETMR